MAAHWSDSEEWKAKARRQLAENWARFLNDLATPPALDSTRFCPCRCHRVLHEGRKEGQWVPEHRLAVLVDPLDAVMACPNCQVAHYKARYREGHTIPSRLFKYFDKGEGWE